MVRRIAVNRVVLNGKEHRQCVVLIDGDTVIDYKPFTEELPFTEWIGGTIELEEKGNVLKIKRQL